MPKQCKRCGYIPGTRDQKPLKVHEKNDLLRMGCELDVDVFGREIATKAGERLFVAARHILHTQRCT